MVMKVIPISSGRTPAPAFAGGTLRDTLGRSMHDLRISVTDGCNFRCVYCMPREVFDANYTFLPHSAILSFEEIARLARIFVGPGVDRVTVSLDSLDEPTFRAMNDVDFPVAKVLESIDAAAAAGLSPVKVNM